MKYLKYYQIIQKTEKKKEGIPSYLQNRRQKALHKVSIAMEKKVNLKCNKIIHLENLMVMYDIYNPDSLEKLFTTVHKIHNTTT